MAAKKKDWAGLLGAGSPGSSSDAVEPEQPKEPPATVLMHTIVGNPDNPRPEEDYSDEDPDFRELKASMREIGQLQPLAVVSSSVFQQAKPEAVAKAPAATRKLIREAEWVVVTGNRRLAAARQLGWTRIDIRVQDRLGDEDGLIDEAVIIENIHRKNIAPIREAEFLRSMVDRHGSQEKVAERIGKTQVYVSQRLALLKLAPDLQDQVDAGELKIKEARHLAGKAKTHDEQRALAAEVQQKRAAAKPERGSRPVVQNPVLNPDTPPAAEENKAAAAGVQNRVLEPAAPPAMQVPDPRANGSLPPAEPEPERRQVKMPWHDGEACADIAHQKMSAEQRTRMIDRLLEIQLAEQDRAAASAHSG